MSKAFDSDDLYMRRKKGVKQMKDRRLRKLISLLVAVSMLLSLSNAVFAGEDTFGEGSLWDDAIVLSTGTNSSSSKNCTLDQLMLVSENVFSMSENLTGLRHYVVQGKENTFIIYWRTAVCYCGKKLEMSPTFEGDQLKNTVAVCVLYREGKESVSQALIDRLAYVGYDMGINLAGNTVFRKHYVLSVNSISENEGFREAEIDKIKLHNSKGATVDVTGKGILPLKKCTYIKSIKLWDDKKLNKDLKYAMKTAITTIKKNKNAIVSANGCIDGGAYGDEDDMIPLVVGMYPIFIGPGTHHIRDMLDDIYAAETWWSNTTDAEIEANKNEGSGGVFTRKNTKFTGDRISGYKLKSITVRPVIKGGKYITLKPGKGMVDAGTECDYITMDGVNHSKKLPFEDHVYYRVEFTGDFYGILYVPAPDNVDHYKD